MKIRAEAIAPQPSKLALLRKQVAAGEGLQVEFKRKVAHPDKVVRGIIAFANTEGGTLFIGVEDDGTLPGVRFPEEEILEIRKALQRYALPRIALKAEILALNKKKFVVRVIVEPHPQRPVFFVHTDGRRECLIRHHDQTLKASFEMREIIRRKKWKRDIHFSFGEPESKLFTYLAHHPGITLQQFRHLVPLPVEAASSRLIKLVLANLLRITPSEKGDVYTRV